MRADMQKEFEKVVIDGIYQIQNKMESVSDKLIDVIVKAQPKGAQQRKLHEIAIKLFESNRSWMIDMSSYLRITGNKIRIIRS